MLKLSLIILTMIASLDFTVAQSIGSIKGNVTDSATGPLEAVTISLYKTGSNKLVKIATSGKSGAFEINNLTEGNYKIVFSAVGFQDKIKENFQVVGETNLGNISLSRTSEDLQQVTVTGKKPMIEVKADKTIVNVESFISNAGGTALDVLEKSPGVTVDRDGIISLKGKQGVIILMDGKQTYLSGPDLANLLRNTPANQLDAVEIMTQPSSKYDASGNSGIINIRTKKGRQDGFSGSINLSYVQGVYPKSPNSLSLNYKKGRVNIFANMNYSYWQGFSKLTFDRKFPLKDDVGLSALFAQESNNYFIGKNAGFRTGLDYSINKNTSIGFQVNGIRNPREFGANSVADIYDGNHNLDSSNIAQSINKNMWKNFGSNINFRTKFDTTGKELTADIDYIWYGSTSKQTSDNYTVYHPQNYMADSFLLRGELPSDIKIYSAKVDYVHPFKKGRKFEAGLKSSYVKTDNDARYTIWDASSKSWINDVRRSNHFLYDENINAAYINYSQEFKKWSIQAGLRMEHTNAKGEQLANNESFNRNYVQLFPTLFTSYKFNDKNTFNASFGRRIERPNYQDMNPFQYFLDQYTYRQGNPFLQPQFSYNAELSHNYKGVLNTTLNFSNTTDIISDILKQIDSTKVTYLTKENIAKRRNVGLAISYNQAIKKWWTISWYGNIFNNYYTGFVNGLPLNESMIGFTTNMNNQFKFAKTWGGEVSGFYRSKLLESGMMVSEPMGVISFGLSKQVMKTKGTVKLNIIDPFYIQQFRGYTKFGSIDTKVHSKWDNRRVGLNFTYRFGKSQAAPQQRRKTGSAADEQNRVGGGNQQ